MRETETSAPSIPAEWGAAVAAKVARAIRHACGGEADKHSFAADEIDDACDASVKAALQALAEAFVIPGDVLATPPTAMAEAVASARAEGMKEGLERAATVLEDEHARMDYKLTDFGEGSKAQLELSIKEIRGLLPAPPTLIPGGSSDV